MQPELSKSIGFKPFNEAIRRNKLRWIVPYTQQKWRHLRAPNEIIERGFNNLLLKVKELYKPLKQKVFEYDAKHNGPLNCTALKVFMAPTIYLELECEYATYRYRVLYDLEQCPFKQELLTSFNKLPLLGSTQHAPRANGVRAFFKSVEAFQNASLFYYL